MERTVKLFVVTTVPTGPVKAARDFTVSASSTDGLRDAVAAKLAADGFRIRSISFGPKGLVAYVEEKT